MSADKKLFTVVSGRINRFEKGRKVSYTPGTTIALSAEEQVKYRFIVKPVVLSAKAHEVRGGEKNK